MSPTKELKERWEFLKARMFGKYQRSYCLNSWVEGYWYKNKLYITGVGES